MDVRIDGLDQHDRIQGAMIVELVKADARRVWHCAIEQRAFDSVNAILYLPCGVFV